MALSDGAKQRLSMVIELTKTAFHYAFIPAVLYLGKLRGEAPDMRKFAIAPRFAGFKQGADPGMPEIALTK